jgi:hypothetical protein
MARKSTTPMLRASILSPDQISIAITRLEARVQDSRTFNPQLITDGDGPKVQALQASEKQEIARQGAQSSERVLF